MTPSAIKKPETVDPSRPDDLLYKIAIELIPKIGSIHAKRLIAYCGGPEAVFKESKRALQKIPGFGDNRVEEIVNQHILSIAEDEIKFIEKYNIRTLYYLDSDYPERLRRCEDGPVLLYLKCNEMPNLDYDKIISVVGTRKASDYGKEFCNTLITDLVTLGHRPIIVSGLAYGIDIAAHRAALRNNLITIAVLGHGLNKIYPTVHRHTAMEIVETGALATDFTSGAKFDRKNFLQRNRIIAGLADATIVVESAETGGALVTADIANSYNRDVLAVPGSVNSEVSSGCHTLIKTNKAALLTNASDLVDYLGWTKTQKQPKQTFINFETFNEDEQKVFNYLKENGESNVDIIALRTGMPVSHVLSTLLNLEFTGAVVSKPGKIFKLS